MTTIRTELHKCQRVLQDTTQIGRDGSLWTRQELLDYFVDGYRMFLAETSATRRFTVLPVPPRFAWSITFPWEAEFVQDGAAFLWAFQTEGGWAASHLWEIELLEGITPTNSGEWHVTHPWERSFANPTHQHFRFAIPRDTERVIKIWHDHQLLIPVSTRALDRTETHWYSLDGEPLAWIRGTGQNRTVEVYEIETTYTDNYRQKDAVTNEGNPFHGIPRRFTGDRTYSWTSESGDTVPYGIARRLSSPDRQYYPRVDEPLRHPFGRSAWFASSVDNLLVLEARIPDESSLTEDDEPSLLPPQMTKYLRWYTLMRAFNRQGEGYDGAMALFYHQRMQRGIAFLRRLHQLARKDRQTQRDPVTRGRRRPPRVRLPSTYPTILR